VACAVAASYLALPSEAAPVGDVSSGHAETRPIQFLDRARSILAGREWCAESAPVVSDFYFDECLAYARLDLDPRAYEQFHRLWEAARQTVAAPKLLVVLDTWEDAVAVRTASPLSLDAAPAAGLRRELLALATRENLGPVLFAGRDDREVQFEEITAAIAAMG
jgi:hypothetical protein